MISCSCYVLINDPERKKLYAGIFPGDKVPVSGNKLITLFQGKQGRYIGPDTKEAREGQVKRFYPMDIARVTKQQLRELANRVSKKFNLDVGLILKDMEDPQHGSPILADGTTFHSCKLHELALRDFM